MLSWIRARGHCVDRFAGAVSDAIGPAGLALLVRVFGRSTDLLPIVSEAAKRLGGVQCHGGAFADSTVTALLREMAAIAAEADHD